MKSKHIKLIAFALAMLSAAIWVHAGTTGIISGIVKGDDGKPLSGANIIITGTKLTTVTAANGYYVITNVPPGDYELRAEMVGYAEASSDHIQVTMDSTATVNFTMTQEAIKEATAVVTRSRPMISTDQVNTLNLISSGQENLTRTDATADNTVPGVLSALPGVIVEPNGSGTVHIRGGNYNQVGYYIEGIPITDPNMGVFSDNLFSTGVSKFQAYTGGFGAEYGNAISGVLNEVKKTGDTSSGLHIESFGGTDDYRSVTGEFGGSTPGFNFYASTILQRNDVSGSPFLASQTYSDNVVKLVWPGKKDGFTLLGMQGVLQGNIGGSGLPNGTYMYQRYAIAGGIWSHNFNSQSYLTVRPYYIYVDAENSLSMVDDTSYQSGMVVDYANQINDKQLLKLGGSLLYSDNNQYDYTLDNSNTNTFQTALYAEEQLKLASRMTFNVGARFDCITYDRTGRAYVAADKKYEGNPIPDLTKSSLTPRLGMSYKVDQRTAWKADWGQYTRFVPANNVQKIYIDPSNEDSSPGLGSADPQKSTLGEISYEKQVSDSVALRITPYYTNFDNLGALYTDPVTTITQYLNLGKGESRGVEFYVRKKMSQNWQGWLSYTYQTVKSSQNNELMKYTTWDQRHTVTAVADYKTGGWEHSMRADIGSGLENYNQDGHANPRVIFTYSLNLLNPKGIVADSISLNLYNIFNNRQVTQYGAVGVPASFNGRRFLSLGFNRAF